MGGEGSALKIPPTYLASKKTSLAFSHAPPRRCQTKPFEVLYWPLTPTPSGGRRRGGRDGSSAVTPALKEKKEMSRLKSIVFLSAVRSLKVVNVVVGEGN